jgi:hypothetical protein
MIELPRRSVTRFFIPLIDVLTLMFCIFLLMPLVKGSDDGSESEAGSTNRNVPSDQRQVSRDYEELARLRVERRKWLELGALEQRKSELTEEIRRLKEGRIDDLQKKLAIRILEIGEEGKLFYYDPERATDRRVEITAQNAADFIKSQQSHAGARDVFFLLMYPRPLTGDPAFPLLRQREEYDRWFRGVPHGYDVREGGPLS